MTEGGSMVRVVVVGDGPAGLSAALFLAKTGHDVTVYAQDGTAMHYAQLRNYLGIPDIHGSEFQRIAREQVEGFGADVREAEVTALATDGAAFVVTAGEEESRADYLILAGSKACQRLADELGARRRDDGGVEVDTEYRTSVDRVYAVGRVARMERSQAIISAGAGATAALDILAREEGEDVHDWDSPPQD
jgi:thioredoxin reductase (NADPH)